MGHDRGDEHPRGIRRAAVDRRESEEHGVLSLRSRRSRARARFSQTDLFLQQTIPLKGQVRASLGMNVTNLFDQDTATASFVTRYRDGFYLPDAQFFAGFDPEAVVAATPSIRRDARYGLANGYQDRRSIRLQARISF